MENNNFNNGFNNNNNFNNGTPAWHNNTYRGGVGGTYGAYEVRRDDRAGEIVIHADGTAAAPRRRVRLITVIAIVMAAVIFATAGGFAAVRYGMRYAGFSQSGGTGITGMLSTDTAANPTAGALLPQTLLANNLVAASKIQYSRPDLFNAVSDTVVSIKLTMTAVDSGFGFRSTPSTTEKKTDVVASGVMFTTDGYILTNNHVVEGASKVFAVVTETNTADRSKSTATEYEAKLVGTDPDSDIAVLKITRQAPFHAAPIGDSNTLRIGQDIVAIGNPMGMEKSMTAGIVSGLHRENNSLLSAIQIDAAVNPGNSGCPLFDMYGNIVGIVNSKYTANDVVENMGFAITINDAKPVINQLIEGGKVGRPVLGIRFQPLSDEIRGYLGIDDTIEYGFYVVAVTDPGAGRSELLRGDVIVKVEGQDIKTVEDVQKQIRTKKAGDTVKLTVYRLNDYGKGENIEISMKLINE